MVLRPENVQALTASQYYIMKAWESPTDPLQATWTID